jgi:hypothetical protein
MLDMFQQDFDRQAAPQANEGRDLPATFGESFQDAWQSGQDAVSSLKAENARNQTIGEYAEAVKGAGGDVDAEYQKEAASSGNLLWASPPDPLTVINNVVAGMKAQADAAGVPMPVHAADRGRHQRPGRHPLAAGDSDPTAQLAASADLGEPRGQPSRRGRVGPCGPDQYLGDGHPF